MVTSSEFASKFRDETQRNLERMQALVDSFVVNPADPPMALTHREVIWKRGKARLFRYHSTETPIAHATPYLTTRATHSGRLFSTLRPEEWRP